MKNITKAIRTDGGPGFIELETYRWREHCGPNYDNDIGYRTEDEFEMWKNNDPLGILEKRLIINKENGLDLEEEKVKIRREIDEAFNFAEESAFPRRDELLRGVYA